MNHPFKIADALVDRLAHGHDHHCQRWHLHLPREGESTAAVRPLLVLLGLPTFGLAIAISVLTTYGPVILIHLVQSPTVVGASTQSFQPVTSLSRHSPIRFSSAAWASCATGPSEFPST